MIHLMLLDYLLYFLIVVSLSILMSVAFRRFQDADQNVAPQEDDQAFERRMAAIEKQFGKSERPDPNEVDAHSTPKDI